MKFTINTDNWFKSTKQEQPQAQQRSTELDYWNPIMGTLGFSSYNQYSTDKAMKLGTTYRCVEVLSSSIAVLPLQPYELKENWKYKKIDDLYYLLNVKPSPVLNAFTFKKLIIQNMLLKGNCFIKITRNPDASIKAFEVLNSDYIKVLLDGQTVEFNTPVNGGGKKEYLNIKTGIIYDDFDIIHILNYTQNGLVGLSTIASAALTLGIAYNSDVHASNFFESGANLNGILKPSAGVNISKEKASAAKDNFVKATTSIDSKSGSIVVLENGLEFQPISVSPRDAQLLESREFNILNICQFFGVPPSKVFDTKGANYSSTEASQLDFLNSTLLALCEKIELEFYAKIYSKIEYPFTELEFITDKLLRLDATTQASYFSQLYNMGAISTNEIREKINAAYPVAGGNQHFIQVNLQDISKPITAPNNIDNNLK